MTETADNTYATNGSNAAAGAPNKVAVVNDGTGDRQIVVLGAGDGTSTIVDGTVTNPINTDSATGATTANQTNGTQQTKITDGTNVANTLKSNGTAAGQNALLTGGSYLEESGLSTPSVTNNDVLASTDVANYKWASLQLTGTWTGSVTVQVSNDNSTFVTMNILTPSSSVPVSTVTAVGTWFFPLHTRYVRIRVTTGGTGTVTGVVEFFTNPSNWIQTQVNATQSGTWTVGSNSATGSAVPANAFYLGVNSGAGNLGGLNSMAGQTDAQGATTALGAGLIIYNNTNFDRLRSATAASNTTGTGLLGVGNLIFDGTNWQAIRAGQTDAATTGIQTVEARGYNGATFDRTRNNTTNVVIAAGATTGQSVTTTTYNARSVVIIINVSAYTSGTMNIAINLLSSSGYSYSPFTSITGLAATGTVVYRIGLGLTPVVGLTANDVLGRSLQVVTSGTFSLTYGIDVNLSI